MRPPSWQKGILRPGKGAESHPEPPRPFPLYLLVSLAAQRGAAPGALQVWGSRWQEGTPALGTSLAPALGGAAPGRGMGFRV